jgi:hypothetical protein
MQLALIASLFKKTFSTKVDNILEKLNLASKPYPRLSKGEK